MQCRLFFGMIRECNDTRYVLIGGRECQAVSS
jgi:hypothetical protein